MDNRDIAKLYLELIQNDLRDIMDKIDTDYQYAIVSDNRLRPDYRVKLILDTTKIKSSMFRIWDTIEKYSNNVE
jgi:hypothetical protein